MAGHIQDAGRVDWLTPKSIREATYETFGGIPDLDPCTNAHSLVDAHRKFVFPLQDGLLNSWKVAPATKAYFNPPFGDCHRRPDTGEIYSRKEFAEVGPQETNKFLKSTIADWLRLAAEYAEKDAVSSIGLIPAAVGTSHWQKYVFDKAAAVCWHKGRIHFECPRVQCCGEKFDEDLNPQPCQDGAVWVNGARLFKCDRCRSRMDKWHRIEGPAPMDCAVVLWTLDYTTKMRFQDAFGPLGRVTLHP